MSIKSPAPTCAQIEAGEWLTIMSQRLVSIDQRNEFQAWLEADPEHVRAYEAGKDLFQNAGACADLLKEARAEETALLELRRKRLRYAGMAAGAVLAASAALFAARELSWSWPGRGFETVTGQVKDVQLDDGTLVTLGAASQIEIEFGKHERRVELARGEAFFEVARDTRRPFLVTAGDTLIRVLGTKFDVHYGQRAVRVAVADGRVEVMHAPEAIASAPQHGSAQRQLLAAGETAVATKAGAIITSIHQANKEDLGAWRQGRLVYVDARLKEIVSDMNRYFDGEIQLADAGLGERQLTMTFRADEIEQGIELIEGALPVRAVRTGKKKVLLAYR